VNDRCEIAGCRAEADLSYLDHGICSTHWSEFSADDAPPDALRMALGIEAEAPTAMEVPMAETKTKATTKSKATEKKSKAPKSERAPKDSEATKVFAFRLTPAESAAIHKTAGPRNATRMVRAIAVAFASEDEGAFKAILKEAREARQ
jgi:hypothetical protein